MLQKYTAATDAPIMAEWVSGGTLLGLATEGDLERRAVEMWLQLPGTAKRLQGGTCYR